MKRIYIKDFEIPNRCLDCPVINESGYCSILRKSAMYEDCRRSDCPLMEWEFHTDGESNE